jgi:hypothetical protein
VTIHLRKEISFHRDGDMIKSLHHTSNNILCIGEAIFFFVAGISYPIAFEYPKGTPSGPIKETVVLRGYESIELLSDKSGIIIEDRKEFNNLCLEVAMEGAESSNTRFSNNNRKKVESTVIKELEYVEKPS